MKLRVGAYWVLLGIFTLQSCGDDDIKKVDAIPAQKIQLNKDRTIGGDIIYSDSAMVKAKGFAPIIDKITESNGNLIQEMPQGVKIDFYENGLIKGSITSDYAIRKESERKTIFKKNVVIIYPEGKYVTEELTWDEIGQVYLSPSGVYTKKDGTILNAKNFNAAQDFSRVSMSAATAEVHTDAI